ncbi:UDP-glucosyltransferase 2-like [Periplaneta americana]|uniref:UDP-glucosyltransferase 2-like n=1 Tax=Periplaneta americana TaxID=6978 RepID=UPI0037E848FF
MLTAGVVLLHDNAPPHKAWHTAAVLTEFGWELFHHPPYSPDLAPSDFHVFLHLKKLLSSDERFGNDEELKTSVTRWFHSQAMKCSYILIICALPICISEAARILALMNFSARSHYVMYQKLFKDLAARGHQVDVYGQYPLEKPVPNYTDVVIAAPAFLQDVSIEKLRGTGIFQILTHYKHNMLDTCRAALNNQNILNLMNSNKTYDVVITYLGGPDCLIGFSHRFKAPLIGVTASACLPWIPHRIGNPDNTAYIPNSLMSFRGQMNFWERLVNTVFDWAMKAWYHIEVNILVEETLKMHFGKDYPSLNELQRSTSLILVNSHFSVNSPRPTVPTFVEVGGLHINSDGKLPEDLQTYLDEAKEEVIYFSMGSIIRSETFTETKLRAFIDAFSQLPQRVLWKIGNISDLSDNVKTAAWLPQLQILKHPNVRVFITHGGNLGTQEAIYAGVPMVGIPIMADQPLNVKNCVSKGVAVQLDYDSITTENVLKALSKVLHDPSYHRNAKRLSQLFRDRPQSALDTAIYWTEYVIRHRGAPHLRSAALDLTWYQYLLLDVILVIIGFAIIVGFMIFYSFKIMLKLVTGILSHAAVKNRSFPKPFFEKARKNTHPSK